MEQQEEIQSISIDLAKLWLDIVKHRRLYYKVLPVTFIVAAIITLSKPNYYSCTVKLSPELSGSRSASSLAGLASSFGFNLSGSMRNATDALFPTLYPDLMNSVDFKTSLFPVKIHKKDSTRLMTYYDYLMYEQKRPWWSAAIGGLKRLLTPASNDGSGRAKQIDPFQLTAEQSGIIQSLNQKIVCSVDKNTMVITIDVVDQDPLIAATMADSVKARLQAFITDYRTHKARVDLDYSKKLYEEAKARYVKARQLYADFVDSNQDLVLQSVRQKQTDLENDMQLQYNAYTHMAAQMMAAEARVQEDTPAFTTLQSATVPIRKMGPNRSKICLIFLFLALLGTTIYIFYREDDLKMVLGIRE